jgi:hypothetical protein
MINKTEPQDSSQYLLEQTDKEMKVRSRRKGNILWVTSYGLYMMCSPKGSCFEELVPSWWIQLLRGDWIMRALTSSVNQSLARFIL